MGNKKEIKIEQTLVLIKPDAVQRALIGEIISRFEKKGLKIVAMKIVHLNQKKAEEFYAVHKGKKFYEPLVKYISSSPIVAICFEGIDAVSLVRKMIGDTDPANAQAGTLRGDYGISISRNIVHGSDSKENAKKELDVIFNITDFVEYEKIDEKWLYEI